MFKEIKSAIRIRAFIVFTLVHLGLALGIFALARLSVPNGLNDPITKLFLFSIICLYGGFMLAVFFILMPLLPWIQRYHRVRHWTENLLEQVPIILAALPQIIAIVKAVAAAWHAAQVETSTEKTIHHKKSP